MNRDDDERDRRANRIANGRKSKEDRLHCDPVGRLIVVPVRVLRYCVTEG